ncbi:lipopolysaccharide heptosyltransferase 1, partial [Klebsiella pneumoniae]|nr:lipopolysaccharide heptosyltransferase 1 [Klebsiella pneumoniae]
TAPPRHDQPGPETRWPGLLLWWPDRRVPVKLPWGAPHEEARAKRLAEGREYVEVLPRMSLGPVAPVLAGAPAVVSVATGPSHLTAAPGQPPFPPH